MYRLIKRFRLVLLVMSMASLTITFGAFALTLELKDAKLQGMVGEMPNGYLGAVIDNKEVKALVEKVNNRREQLYNSLAKKNKIALKQVSDLAGKTAIKKTASGNYIQNPTGKWVKK